MHFIYLPFEASLQTPDRFFSYLFYLSSPEILIIVMSIILYSCRMHAFIDYIFCPNCLASTFKYSPGLLIWPDVDEGDLMDEEFDSASDA